MEDNNKLGLIVAFYLSKFDREALKNLGYSNFSEAFKEIGRKLNIKPNTIKNMREQFDPYYDNPRVGWYQRELTRSRIDVLEKFDSLSKDEITEIVRNILDENESEYLRLYTGLISDDNEVRTSERKYTTRGVTGKKGEHIFKQFFNQTLKQQYTKDVELIDTRDLGCGYDFEVNNNGNIEAVYEVKSCIDNNCREILLTNKEWHTAEHLKERYNIVIVSGILNIPKVTIHNNPSQKFNPKLCMQKSISVTWKINNMDLSRENMDLGIDSKCI